ncbi:MAG: hypothetical protein U0350_42785 [Caldilineaceae bacterium]
MVRTKWVSLGASLGLLCLFAILTLFVTRCTSIMRPIPITSTTNAPITNQVKPTSAISLTTNSSISTTRVLTAAQAITHSDWLTFTDPEAGYMIQYPHNFIIHTGKNKGDKYNITIITFFLPNVNMYQAMSIQIEPNPTNSSIDTVIQQIYQKVNKKPLELKASDTLAQMTIAGMVAYKTDLLPGSTDFHILLPSDSKVYHFALVHGLGPIESAPEAKTIFFQILETFKIVNPQ